MIDQALVDELSAARNLPRLALARAILYPPAVAPALLSVLERAANGTTLTEEQDNLLFWGIHILGAARDERAFAPLMRLLRREPGEIEPLLGDATSETLPRVVAGVFDGTSATLHELLADRTVDDFIRWSVFGALTFLTWVGKIDRDETTRFLERFDDERLAEAEDTAWVGWQEAIAILGLRALAERVHAAWDDGRLTEAVSDRADFDADLRRAEDNPDDPARFTDENLGYIADLIEALEWVRVSDPDPLETSGGVDWPATIAEEDEWLGKDVLDLGQPAHNPFRHVGRNDPCPCGSGKKAKKCCLAA